MEQIVPSIAEAGRTSTTHPTEQLDEELERRARDAIEEPRCHGPDRMDRQDPDESHLDRFARRGRDETSSSSDHGPRACGTCGSRRSTRVIAAGADPDAAANRGVPGAAAGRHARRIARPLA
jgi:hypothetical protein